MDTAKHTMWITTLRGDLFTLTIKYCQVTTKETVIEGVEAVKKKVIAFKTLYDGDFNVISDVNFT